MTQNTDPFSERLKAVQISMQKGDFDSALEESLQVLAEAPDNQQALYCAAVCFRYKGQYKDAKNLLENLKKLSPDHGRAYQEDGHLYRVQGAIPQAINAYKRATQYNPALIASWNQLAELNRQQGNTQGARQALLQSQRLQALPKQLLAVTNHIHEGRILIAEELARAFLQKHPSHVEGMRLLADIGTRLGVHDDADLLLEAASELQPDNLQIRIDRVQVLRKRQKFAAALKEAEALHAREPNNPVFRSLLAIEQLQAGDYENALEGFDEVLDQVPNDPATLTSRGHALKTYGRTDDAIASYRAAIKADPLYGEAWYALANLKTFKFTDAETKEMEAISQKAELSYMARVNLNFALAKAYEDAQAYEQAFRAYTDGNTLKSKQTRYTTEQMLEEFDAQKVHCTSSLFPNQANKGCNAPDPIFIVGLPRAGSTLIEQILASHSQVDGTLELPNILSFAHQLRGRKQLSDRQRYPRILHDLSAEQLRELGQKYIDETQIHRKGAAYFTDKMPNNFRHIGLIHLILPNAKIIDARRDPMDCCWSGFKQLFAEGQEFSYALDDIGSYYNAYVDLMSHWEDTLPEGRILKVQHEDVLTNTEGQVRRILEYCDLPFEQACVDFHNNKRAVRTASSEQVRQPINQDGVGQWLPYEKFLDPLKLALGKL
ncbi:MAG: tetratricopeptide repeat-containing sulfotransferase family protein [Hyphomonas sp.]